MDLSPFDGEFTAEGSLPSGLSLRVEDWVERCSRTGRFVVWGKRNASVFD